MGRNELNRDGGVLFVRVISIDEHALPHQFAGFFVGLLGLRAIRARVSLEKDDGFDLTLEVDALGEDIVVIELDSTVDSHSKASKLTRLYSHVAAGPKLHNMVSHVNQFHKICERGCRKSRNFNADERASQAYAGSMSLDPEDQRPPYQQVASALRAAILTGKIAPGQKLPSQRELGETYGVARMTVQQALRILKDEGLTYSRQGSGVYARERVARPVGLRPHIERAMESSEVVIDFHGYTAETLQGALAEPLDKIRAGRLTPQSLRLRLLLPDLNANIPIPRAASNRAEENDLVRGRMSSISVRSVESLASSMRELQEVGLIHEAHIVIRRMASSPTFKAYLINERDAFHALYPIVKRTVSIQEEDLEIFDAMGKDATLFQHSDDGDPSSVATQFVHQLRGWYESVWDCATSEEVIL